MDGEEKVAAVIVLAVVGLLFFAVERGCETVRLEDAQQAEQAIQRLKAFEACVKEGGDALACKAAVNP